MSHVPPSHLGVTAAANSSCSCAQCQTQPTSVVTNCLCLRLAYKHVDTEVAQHEGIQASICLPPKTHECVMDLLCLQSVTPSAKSSRRPSRRSLMNGRSMEVPQCSAPSVNSAAPKCGSIHPHGAEHADQGTQWCSGSQQFHLLQVSCHATTQQTLQKTHTLVTTASCKHKSILYTSNIGTVTCRACMKCGFSGHQSTRY